MEAIFRAGNRQYKAIPGEEVLVDLLPVAVGSEVRFDDVLLVISDSGVKIGAPRVPGAAVVGKVLAETKGRKIRAVKFRRRKDSKTVKGHRQRYHRVRITAIEVA
ncbi:MAG: 50S ribosomal protein L21 [Planctomycetota bacterium]|nr:50S ribosomal protein L21 [Planctomycetota bacterium]